MPNVNITLSVTVPEKQRLEVLNILAGAMHDVAAIPGLVSANLTIFGDDFADAFDQATKDAS